MAVPVGQFTAISRPPERPAGWQQWRHLLFLHWAVPPGALQAHLPAGLTLDTWEGRGYVGLVAFTMPQVRPWWLPPLPGPWRCHFHELNVRTYVHRDGQAPGVWFFSLDAASRVAALAARLGWRLPYYHARMRLVTEAGWIQYQSERRAPGPRPARFEARYQMGAALGAAAPGTLEHFLVERYQLYADGSRGGLKLGRVQHRPYPLRRAEVHVIHQSMLTAAGLPAPDGPPHVLYSPGVDVAVYSLRQVAQADG